jgi:hypothetical protein
MPTPPKSAAVLESEKRSHRTKNEMQGRKDAEKALMTGVVLRERTEVENNPAAHAEFLRVGGLLEKIGKNDAIYEPIINRYCLLQAECLDLQEMREMFLRQLEGLETREGLEYVECCRLQAQMQKSILDADRQLQTKRKMLFDIERENGMTIAAALRSIPKRDDKPENPVKAAIKG